MPSPHSIFWARCVFVPATLAWCALTLDNPHSRAIRAWARVFQPPAMPGIWATDFAWRRSGRPATSVDALAAPEPAEQTAAERAET